jgi:secreted Zn-dependent insulinase-like peptidase
LRLANSLEVLLISDSETDYSAASLSVGVGSLHNPENMPGLAHFLEHMLFRGSQKYPKVNEFVDRIKKCNGVFNAYTAAEETNYYF